ncbi:hypothetical protein C8R45DRAFT_1167431 [Mycena sanguinolenta]|nr:hypothetical protein C8R45DRAFT_1167431 [Mycena sanguinolenta]
MITQRRMRTHLSIRRRAPHSLPPACSTRAHPRRYSVDAAAQGRRRARGRLGSPTTLRVQPQVSPENTPALSNERKLDMGIGMCTTGAQPRVVIMSGVVGLISVDQQVGERRRRQEKKASMTREKRGSSADHRRVITRHETRSRGVRGTRDTAILTNEWWSATPRQIQTPTHACGMVNPISSRRVKARLSSWDGDPAGCELPSVPAWRGGAVGLTIANSGTFRSFPWSKIMRVWPERMDLPFGTAAIMLQLAVMLKGQLFMLFQFVALGVNYVYSISGYSVDVR